MQVRRGQLCTVGLCVGKLGQGAGIPPTTICFNLWHALPCRIAVDIQGSLKSDFQLTRRCDLRFEMDNNLAQATSDVVHTRISFANPHCAELSR